jgi:hypothetical protein
MPLSSLVEPTLCSSPILCPAFEHYLFQGGFIEWGNVSLSKQPDDGRLLVMNESGGMCGHFKEHWKVIYHSPPNLTYTPIIKPVAREIKQVNKHRA